MTDLQEIRTSCYIDRSRKRLYEQLQDGKFAYLSTDGRELKKVDYLDIGRCRYLPIDDKVTQDEIIPLPTGAMEYGTTKQLVEDVDKHIKKYFDCSPRFLYFAKLYVPMSWVTSSLDVISYLRFLGDYGTGKSRGFKIIGKLCYKPIMFGGAITSATLYRLMDKWHGTLLLDECVLKDSTKSSDTIQILNTGIEKDGYIWRCGGDDYNPEPFLTFGPKIVGARERFTDSALESRCITEKTEETTNSKIPIVLPKECYEEQTEVMFSQA